MDHQSRAAWLGFGVFVVFSCFATWVLMQGDVGMSQFEEGGVADPQGDGIGPERDSVPGLFRIAAGAPQSEWAAYLNRVADEHPEFFALLLRSYHRIDAEAARDANRGLDAEDAALGHVLLLSWADSDSSLEAAFRPRDLAGYGTRMLEGVVDFLERRCADVEMRVRLLDGLLCAALDQGNVAGVHAVGRRAAGTDAELFARVLSEYGDPSVLETVLRSEPADDPILSSGSRVQLAARLYSRFRGEKVAPSMGLLRCAALLDPASSLDSLLRDFHELPHVAKAAKGSWDPADAPEPPTRYISEALSAVGDPAEAARLVDQFGLVESDPEIALEVFSRWASADVSASSGWLAGQPEDFARSAEGILALQLARAGKLNFSNLEGEPGSAGLDSETVAISVARALSHTSPQEAWAIYSETLGDDDHHTVLARREEMGSMFGDLFEYEPKAAIKAYVKMAEEAEASVGRGAGGYGSYVGQATDYIARHGDATSVREMLDALPEESGVRDHLAAQAASHLLRREPGEAIDLARYITRDDVRRDVLASIARGGRSSREAVEAAGFADADLADVARRLEEFPGYSTPLWYKSN